MRSPAEVGCTVVRVRARVRVIKVGQVRANFSKPGVRVDCLN